MNFLEMMRAASRTVQHVSKSLAWTMVLLALVACDTHTGPSESAGITVYEHPDFEGDSRTLDGSVWDLDDVRGPCSSSADYGGDWDDCISSIRVPAGWEGVLYEHDEYEGDSLVVSSDIRDLDDVRGPCGGDWDDCVSSIRVRPSSN